MKVKNLEKEIERKFRTCMKEFSNLITLYEAYTEEASDKRQTKFTKKMVKKYGKEVERLEDRADDL